MICTTIRSPKPDFFSLGKLQISEMQTHGATLAPIARSSVGMGQGKAGRWRDGGNRAARHDGEGAGGRGRWWSTMGRKAGLSRRGGEGTATTNSSYRRRSGDGGLTDGGW
jgi:hypothetical protein